MAALDWFATDVATQVPRKSSQPAAAPRPRRAEGRRIRGGIIWIASFAVLLAGVVALNVAVLRVNMSLDRLSRQQIELQAENTTLASQLSSAGSSLRIEQAAHRLGLVPAPASDTSYLDLGH